MRHLLSTVGFAGLALLALGACSRSAPVPETPSAPAAVTRAPPLRVQPPPTENVLGPDAEKKSNAGRRAWIKRMHRARAGFDQEAAERRNGLAQVRRHAALSVAPPAPSGPRWVERGSTNQAGRTHVSRVASDGALYVGSANGGLWRGTLDGDDWTPLGDDTYGGVHFLEVVPSPEPGEPDVLLTATDGGILLRSTNGGATWASMDVGSVWWVRRMAMATDGTNAVFLVTAGNDGVRLLRSLDAGASWAVITDYAETYGDLFVPRDGDATIWLVDGTHVRMSTDLGDSWTDAGVVPAGSGTWDLAGSEAGAPTLYLIGDGGQLWRSDDAAATWNFTGTTSDYWGGSMTASAVNPDFFVYGGVEVHKSFDGGASFTTQNYWYDYYGSPADTLHADIPGIDVIPNGAGGETWFINTDGGTYRSLDGLATVRNVSLYGLRVGQYYDVLTSTANPEHVAIGSQDQGYQLTNRVAQDDDAWEVEQVLSGDYGHLTSGDGSHAFVFSVYPGFILVQIGEDDPYLAYLDFPGGEAYVPWLPPIVADPEARADFFFPATRIWKYTKAGRDNWNSAVWSEQDFRVAGDEYVSRLAFSPVDPRRAVALTSYGRAWYSSDKGVTWAMSPSMVADDNWLYGQAIAHSVTNPDLVTIGGSGYGVPAVYRSEDGGRTYFPWSEGLPDTLVYTLVEAPDGSGRLFAGTETAAYTRGPDDDAWVDITTSDAPVTIYWDAEALPDSNTIRFATYGRGVWDYVLAPVESDCPAGQDADGDGVACDTDCDDADATVYPGAAEACDGVDRDCDAAAPAPGEYDADADGSPACADCDDLDPVRTPGAEELCGDGIDEDCDGEDVDCPAAAAPDDPGGCGCAWGGGRAPRNAPLAWMGIVAAAGLLAARRRA